MELSGAKCSGTGDRVCTGTGDTNTQVGPSKESTKEGATQKAIYVKPFCFQKVQTARVSMAEHLAHEWTAVGTQCAGAAHAKGS